MADMKPNIEIISDTSSERLYKRVDDFVKDVNVVKIEYDTILNGKEFYAYIFYNDKEVA